jgi:SPP1 family predicted phage head-tail adaptor
METYPSIDPGELRQRITIQRAIEGQAASGALTQTWETHATCRAKITRRPGPGERYADNALQTSKSHLVVMYYRDCPDVTEKMRIQWNGKTLDIKDVNDVDGRHVKLILTCLERIYDEPGVRVQ